MSDAQTAETLHLIVEVVGCPTVCRHCWARGAPYEAMPLEDIERVLVGAEEACALAGMRLSAFPMHEVAAHPEVGAVLELFTAHGGEGVFSPFVTTGVPLAVRDDWEAVVAAIRRSGARQVWVHVHGVAETHDETVAREGAYEDTLLAVRRCRAAGLPVGANVFVTAANVGQIEQAMTDLVAAGAHGCSVEVAGYYPHARLRHMEALRPSPADVEPLLPFLDEHRKLNYESHFWDHLGNYTEDAWRRKAIEGRWDRRDRRVRQVVCRADLAVHQGSAGAYGPLIGNLATDDAPDVWARAVAVPPTTRYDAYFGQVEEPVEDLARRYGREGDQKLHFTQDSVRAAWLDRSHHSPTTFIPVGRRKANQANGRLKLSTD